MKSFPKITSVAKLANLTSYNRFMMDSRTTSQTDASYFDHNSVDCFATKKMNQTLKQWKHYQRSNLLALRKGAEPWNISTEGVKTFKTYVNKPDNSSISSNMNSNRKNYNKYFDKEFSHLRKDYDDIFKDITKEKKKSKIKVKSLFKPSKFTVGSDSELKQAKEKNAFLKGAMNYIFPKVMYYKTNSDDIKWNQIKGKRRKTTTQNSNAKIGNSSITNSLVPATCKWNLKHKFVNTNSNQLLKTLRRKYYAKRALSVTSTESFGHNYIDSNTGVDSEIK